MEAQATLTSAEYRFEYCLQYFAIRCNEATQSPDDYVTVNRGYERLEY